MTNAIYKIGMGTLGGTAAAVGTLPVSAFSKLGLDITTLNAETISVYPSFDGGTTFSTSKIAFALTATPLTRTVVDLTNAAYESTPLPACTHIKFVKSAATNPSKIQWTLRTT